MPAPRNLSPEEMSQRLVAYLARREGLPPEAVRVAGLRRLAGGASRLLWSVDVTLERAGRPVHQELVLRQDPPARSVPGAMALEFELLRAAAEQDVPVPRVEWVCDDSETFGAPLFAMERIEGEAIARRLLRDERYAKTREVMTEELGRYLARIHRIDPEAEALAALPRPPADRTPAEVEIERIVTGVRSFAVEPHPVLELAERWLRARAPEPPALTFVHGDYRVGNVMFDESGIRAVLDWELAHVGDPVEDLGWLCVRAWRFGNDHLPVGGVGTREALVAAYEAEGGAPVDREALRFWEVCGSYKLALVFITQARAYLDGQHKTVELASLGRRIAEAEQELLEGMEGPE